jgi:hypothetical protein
MIALIAHIQNKRFTQARAARIIGVAGMGADYMLIPLMAAEQFGVNTLARAMADFGFASG